MVKVEVKHLTKIFGKKTQAALDMMNDHQPKTEILKKTGATVGVYDVNFDVKEGEIFHFNDGIVVWGGWFSHGMVKENGVRSWRPRIFCAGGCG